MRLLDKIALAILGSGLLLFIVSGVMVYYSRYPYIVGWMLPLAITLAMAAAFAFMIGDEDGSGKRT